MADAGWITLAVFALLALPLNFAPLRRALVSAPLLQVFRSVTPTLSDTEQTALEAGTVGFEGELFSRQAGLVRTAGAAEARS